MVPIAKAGKSKKEEKPKAEVAAPEPLKFIKGKKGKIEAPSAVVAEDADSVKVGKKRTRVQAEIESDVSSSSSEYDSSSEPSLDSDMDTEELE